MADSLMASEQQGDIEYTWKFANQLDSNPLFKLGFNPSNIYYQRTGHATDRGEWGGYGMHYSRPASYYADFDLQDFEKKAEKAKPDTLTKSVAT